LLGAGFLEAAGADEFDRAAQFVLVEPGPVGFADIDDDVGAVGEVHAVHELVADRAGDIADSFFELQGLFGMSGHAHYRRLLFALGANLLQRVDVDPDTFATTAFEQAGGADADGLHGGLASGTEAGFIAGDFAAISSCATAGTKLRAGEHHSETKRARYRG